jgi:hypothetical protein
MSTTTEGIIAREEWVRRYAARIVERAGWSQEEAETAAAVGAEEYERDERARYGRVEWFIDPYEAAALRLLGHICTPEEAADEEMSCWTDDEGSEE